MGGKSGGGNLPDDKQMTALGGPWQPLQSHLQGLIGQIGYLNNNTDLEYGPNIVQPWNAAQNAGVQGGEALAAQGSPYLGGAYGYAGGLGSGGGVGGAPGEGVMQGIAQHGFQDPSAGAYGALTGYSMGNLGGGAAVPQLEATAGGAYLNSNPYLDSMFGSASDAVTRQYHNTVDPSISARMSMAGRLGSDSETDLRGQAQQDLGQQLGNMAANIYGGNYQAERGLQEQAAMALPGAIGQGVDTALSAAGAQSGSALQDLQARLQAAGQATGAYQGDVGQALQAAGMTPNLYGSQFLPYEQQYQLGSLQQQQATQQAQEQHDIFQYQQNAPWQKLQQAIGAYGGIAGMTNPAIAGQYASGLLTQRQNSGAGSGLGTLAGLAGLVGGVALAPYTGGTSLGLTAAGIGALSGGQGQAPQYGYRWTG